MKRIFIGCAIFVVLVSIGITSYYELENKINSELPSIESLNTITNKGNIEIILKTKQNIVSNNKDLTKKEIMAQGYFWKNADDDNAMFVNIHNDELPPQGWHLEEIKFIKNKENTCIQAKEVPSHIVVREKLLNVQIQKEQTSLNQFEFNTGGVLVAYVDKTCASNIGSKIISNWTS